MANVTVSPQQISRSGVDLTDTGSLSTSNNYFMRNTGREFLHFKKTGAGACVVTIVTPKTVAGLAVADVTVSVPATTGDLMIGPFPPDAFNNQNGDVEFTLSEVTGLTVAAASL